MLARWGPADCFQTLTSDHRLGTQRDKVSFLWASSSLPALGLFRVVFEIRKVRRNGLLVHLVVRSSFDEVWEI